MIVTALYAVVLASIPVGFAILIAGCAIQWHLARSARTVRPAIVEPVAPPARAERPVFDQDLHAA